tara:strand:- start:33695 stop:34309 length:615 start_codon:yes stop_codon:yes gene_type:complete
MDKRICIGLDRDGTINQQLDGYCYKVEDFKPIPGSLEAIVNLKKDGFAVVVLTNQSGIARHVYASWDVENVHKHMSNLLYQKGQVDVDGYYHCPFAEESDNGRKPNIGMFLQAQRELRVNFHKGYYVGDKISDLQAAVNMNITPILVRTGFGKLTEERLKRPEYAELAAKTKIFKDLAAFQAWVSLPLHTKPTSLKPAPHPNGE